VSRREAGADATLRRPGAKRRRPGLTAARWPVMAAAVASGGLLMAVPAVGRAAGPAGSRPAAAGAHPALRWPGHPGQLPQLRGRRPV